MKINLRFKNQFYKDFFSWLFIVFVLYDLFAKILSHYEITHCFYQIATIFKLICLGLFFAYDSTYFKKDKTFFSSFVLLILIVLINHFIFYYSYNFQEILFNGYYLTTQLIFFFLYKMISYDQYKFDYSRFIKIFKWFIIINIIFIWIGYFSDLGIFKAYFKNGNRFGFIGVLLYHLEAGYIFFLAIMTFYFDYKKDNKPIDLLGISLILITIPLIGTKKALFLTALFIIYLVVVEGKKLLQKKSFLKITLLVTFISITLYWFKNIFFSKWGVIIDVYERSGITSAIFSYRNILLTENVLPFIDKHWNTINYIIGGPVFKYHRTELEFIDVYLFYGLFGLAVFFILLRKIYLENKTSISRFTIIALLTTTALGGNLFTSINTALLFFVILKYFEENLKQKIIQ